MLIVLPLKSNGNLVGKGQSNNNKPESFESEIDDVVFGTEHDDIDLSPQTKRRTTREKSFNQDSPRQTERARSSSPGAKFDESPMMDSADDKSESFPPNEPETPLQQEITSPSGVSASTKKKSPVDDDNLSISSEEHVQASPQDDDELSVESPFGGTTSMADSPLTATTSKWKGYSHRVLHPPHPLDSLFRIDELLKAARRRAERRKKGKKKKASHKKSSRRARQRTSTRTKLVFE